MILTCRQVVLAVKHAKKDGMRPYSTPPLPLQLWLGQVERCRAQGKDTDSVRVRLTKKDGDCVVDRVKKVCNVEEERNVVGRETKKQYQEPLTGIWTRPIGRRRHKPPAHTSQKNTKATFVMAMLNLTWLWDRGTNMPLGIRWTYIWYGKIEPRHTWFGL